MIETTEMAQIEGELNRYCEKHRLTPRESEILKTLANRIVSIKDIAGNLSLSPNTVNNHLTSIFDKTKTRSKSELLATVLQFVSQALSQGKSLTKSIRVLVLDDETDLCDLIGDYLGRQGMKVDCLYRPELALETIKNGDYDFVISDVMMPGLNGFEFLRTIKQTYRYRPQVIIISGGLNVDRAEVLHHGGIAFLEKPLDLVRMVNLMREYSIENLKERADLFYDDDRAAIRCDQGFKLPLRDLGVGGAFLNFNEDMGMIKSQLRAGERISFQFVVENQEQPIQAIGEVMWMRSFAKLPLLPGAGVRFLLIEPEGQQKLEHLVRQNNILSFIPLGTR